MKKILFLSLALFSTQLLSAQVINNILNNAEHRYMLGKLLQPQMQMHTVAMKTTSVVKERLIAQSLLDNTLLPPAITDSMHLSYSGNRGSAYDFNMIFYAFNYPYGNTPMFNYNGLFTKPQVMYDTIQRSMIAPGKILFDFFSEASAKYDVLNDITSYKINFADPATYQDANYLNTYNAAGNIVSGYTFFLVSGVTDSAYKQYYSYNSSNRLTEDSIYVYTGTGWRMVAKTYYTYNAAGNPITIETYADSTAPLREKIKYENTYDAGGHLLTVLTSYFDGTSLTPYVKDTFAYTPGLNFNTSWKEYQYDGINHYWAPYFYEVKHINAAALPDTLYIKGFDSLANSWVPQTMQVANYDTFRLPTTLYSYQYNGTAYPLLASNVTSYYYQRYNDNTGVATTTNKHNVVIYPNPVEDNVNIKIEGLAANTNILITLYNTSGQIVRSLSTVWQSNALQMPMADLNTGVYWINVQDRSGTILSRQSVIKR